MERKRENSLCRERESAMVASHGGGGRGCGGGGSAPTVAGEGETPRDPVRKSRPWAGEGGGRLDEKEVGMTLGLCRQRPWWTGLGQWEAVGGLLREVVRVGREKGIGEMLERC